MTDRERFEEWYKTTTDVSAFSAWQAATLAERERWQNQTHTTQTYEPAPYWLNPNFKMPVSS